MLASIAHQRLHQQRLTQGQLAAPEEAVAWLGAVQAQDYPGALWSLGMRLQDSRITAVEQAFNLGRILRTHVMRPTWHFVTPADIRWLLELTAPRVRKLLTYNDRQLGLDAALLRRCHAAIAAALQGGRQLTRRALAEALAQAGLPAEGLRLGHILMHAELDGLVCSGPRIGKQFTYALLDERAPQTSRLERDQALGELTRRYFTAHGPATVRDFTWWSGLTAADARNGLALAGDSLAQARIDGQVYWSSPSMPPDPERSGSGAAFLLPTYDEYIIGYAVFDRRRRAGVPQGREIAFSAVILYAGQVIGTWRRTINKGSAFIELAPFDPLSPAQQEAIAEAAGRYAEFLMMPVLVCF